MAKFFSLLLASALLLVLAQARPEPASSEENKVQSSEESDSGVDDLDIFFASVGLDSFVKEQVNAVVLPVVKVLRPIVEKVIQEAEKVSPQSVVFKERIAQLNEFIETEKKNDESTEVDRSQLFLDLDNFFKYNELDDTNPDDAFFKKTLKENGIEEIAKEFHYRRVVFALNLFPKVERFLDLLRKNPPEEAKEIPTAEQIHEKFASLDLDKKEAALIQIVKAANTECNKKKEEKNETN